MPNTCNAIDDDEDAARDVVKCFLPGLGMFDRGPLEKEGSVEVLQVEINDVQPFGVNVMIGLSIVA